MENPDETLGVKFFIKAMENPRKSKEAGRPIFDDVEMVSIIIPGDTKQERVAPAHEMHFVSHKRQQMTYAERFRTFYEAFRDEREDFIGGTPLDLVTFLTPSQREELTRQKIRTVEQLAGLQDRIINRMGPGWREKVEAAQAYLKRSEGTAEVEALKAQIAELQAMLAPAQSDPFDGFDRDDLFNMAQDAGLEPRANASRESLVKMLADAAAKKAKEAA
jgi:hypothetical protein